jgi:periplasmic divalent cation tolerance protein
MEPVEVEVTCPDAACAHRLAEAVVAARLAACGWVIPGVQAVYRWQGAVETTPEVLLRLKSRADLFEPLCALIRAHHPYDLPAIVAVPVARLGPGVAAWWETETRASGRGTAEG